MRLDQSLSVVDGDGDDRGSTLEGGIDICRNMSIISVFNALEYRSHLLAGNCALLLRDRSSGLYSDNLFSAASAGVD